MVVSHSNPIAGLTIIATSVINQSDVWFSNIRKAVGTGFR